MSAFLIASILFGGLALLVFVGDKGITKYNEVKLAKEKKEKIKESSKENLNRLYECHNPDCGVSFRLHQYLNFSLSRKYSGCPHCQTLFNVPLDLEKVEKMDLDGIVHDLEHSHDVTQITAEKVLESRKYHISCPSLMTDSDFEDEIKIIKQLSEMKDDDEIQRLYKEYDERVKNKGTKYTANLANNFEDIHNENHEELMNAQKEFNDIYIDTVKKEKEKIKEYK